MKHQEFNAKITPKLFKYLPYPLLGLLVFYANSQLNFNYLVKGYLSLLELQIGFVVIYFLGNKLAKKHKYNKKIDNNII